MSGNHVLLCENQTGKQQKRVGGVDILVGERAKRQKGLERVEHFDLESVREGSHKMT